jgi:hypothetical protein
MRLSIKKSRLETSVSILTLAAFLLLGFCPLRNALIKEFGGSPEKAGKPLPEYRKITSANYCQVVCLLKTIPSTGRVDHLPSIWPAGGLPGSSFIGRIAPACITSQCVGPLSPWQPSLPLYIRNRVLRL